MKLIFVTALLASSPLAAPQWIKINEVEHAVPPYMTPDQYYQSITGRPRPVHTTYSPLPRTNPPANLPLRWNAGPLLPTPAPIIAVPRRPSNLFTSRFTSDAYPMVTPAPLPTLMRRPFVAAAPVSNQIMPNYSPIGISNRPFYRSSSSSFPASFMNNQMSFQRQWVKIREGTDPIEVPAGRDPQEFLNGLKFGGAVNFRSLAGNRKCKKGNCGIFVPPPPPPIPVVVKTVAVFPLPRPIIPYNKGKMTFAPPPPPFIGGGYSKGATPFAPPPFAPFY